MPPAERLEKARAVALRLLGSRERSALEIRQRLRQRGFDPETVARVAADLVEAGLQDDRRFAAQAVESGAARGFSSRAIQQRLRRAGLGSALAAQAAAEDEQAEEARAREAAARRAARLAGSPPDVRFRRLSSFLAGRGYPPELCRRLAAELAEVEPEL